MTAKSIKAALHLLCSSLLMIGFLGIGIGSWALMNDSGEGGVNIGAGLIWLFGYAAGGLGMVFGAAALVAQGVVHRQGQLHT